MTYGVIQLVATGIRNKKHNENPQTSFFKKVFVSHTPFYKYNINLTNGDNKLYLNQETNVSSNILINSAKGDLLSNIHMEVNLDSKTNLQKFIRGFAVGLIENITLIIGGTKYETLTPDNINIYNELWLKEAKRQYNDYMVGNKYLPGVFTSSRFL